MCNDTVGKSNSKNLKSTIEITSNVLNSFQYVFETERESDHKKTVHEELVKNLGVSLRSTHDATVIKNLLKVCGKMDQINGVFLIYMYL